MPAASSSDSSARNPQPNALALLPFFVFVLFYAGLSAAAGSFDVVPMAVAFSVAGAAAIAMDRGRPLARRIDSFTRGMGEPNLMLMCLIFVFAGAFATVAKASGAVDAAVAIARALIPARFMLAGMFAEITFFTDSQSNVVVIPTEAIQTGVDGSYVYVLDSDNIAHRVSVETGLVGDGVTEVTSGLAEGDALVTVGQFYLSEGTQARVVPHQQGD